MALMIRKGLLSPFWAFNFPSSAGLGGLRSSQGSHRSSFVVPDSTVLKIQA